MSLNGFPGLPAAELEVLAAFQRTHLLGDRGLCVAELLGRGGQRAVLVGGQEAAQLMQRKHRNLLWIPLETEATPRDAKQR